MEKSTWITILLIIIIFTASPSSIGFTTMSADRTINADVSKENSGILNISNEADSIKQGASGATLVNVTNPLTRTQNNTVKLSDETTWNLSSTGDDKKTVTLSSGESQTYKVDVGSSATTGNATYWIIARDGVYTFNQSRQVKIKSSSSSEVTYADIIDTFEDQDFDEYSVGSVSSVQISSNHVTNGSYSMYHPDGTNKIVSIHDGSSDLDNYINDGTNVTADFSIESTGSDVGFIFGYNPSTGTHYRFFYSYSDSYSSGIYAQYYDGNSYNSIGSSPVVVSDVKSGRIELHWENYGQRARVKFRVKGSGVDTNITRLINKENRSIKLNTNKSTGYYMGNELYMDDIRIENKLAFQKLNFDDFEDGDLKEYSQDGGSLTTSTVHSGSYALALSSTKTIYNQSHPKGPLAPNGGDTLSFNTYVEKSGGGATGKIIFEKSYTMDGSGHVYVEYSNDVIDFYLSSGTLLHSTSISPSKWYRIKIHMVDGDTIEYWVYDGGSVLAHNTFSDNELSIQDTFDENKFELSKSGSNVYVDNITITNSNSNRDFS